MSIFLLLVVYRVPKIRELKSKVKFLYQIFGCPEIQGIEMICVYTFIQMKDRHTCVSVCNGALWSTWFSLHVLCKDSRTQNLILILYQKFVIWDQWTLRLSLFITFIAWEDRHKYVSVLCW